MAITPEEYRKSDAKARRELEQAKGCHAMLFAGLILLLGFLLGGQAIVNALERFAR